MTKKQKEMFDKNQNLIHVAINTYIKSAGRYGINEREDLESIGMYGLYKAIITYDDTKGSFSNYAIHIIRNNIFRTLRDNSDLNDNSCSADADKYVELISDLAYNNIQSMQDDMDLKEGLEIMERCGKKYGGIAEKGVNALRLNILGYSCAEIAQAYGVDANTITSWISRARKKLSVEKEVIAFLK